MKNLLRCPKCAGKRIWVIEKYRIPGESAEGRVLSLVVHQTKPEETRFLGDLLGSLQARPQGHLDLFVCDGCGYAELWAGGVRDLVADPARGIRLIDTSDVGAGPFR